MDTAPIAELSKALSDAIRTLHTQRGMVEAEIADLERQHNHIIHRMESPDCKHKERYRLSTQLANVRKDRRRLKDWLKINQQYFNYFGSNDGEKVQNMISRVVGVGKKVEEVKQRQGWEERKPDVERRTE